MSVVLGLESLDVNNKKVFAQLLEKLTLQLQILPDKPEETPQSALCTLWHFASEHPLSCAAAIENELSELDSDGLDRLDILVNKRLQG